MQHARSDNSDTHLLKEFEFTDIPALGGDELFYDVPSNFLTLP